MLLRLFDVFSVGGGLLHGSCLHWGALGTRSICYIPEYTSGCEVAAHNRGGKREGRFDQAVGGTAQFDARKIAVVPLVRDDFLY